MNVNQSSKFKRSYKKLSAHLKDDFDDKIIIFLENPIDPRLKTHKLKGRLQDCLVFRLCNGYRVLFEFSSRDEVDLLDIGPINTISGQVNKTYEPIIHHPQNR